MNALLNEINWGSFSFGLMVGIIFVSLFG